VSERRAQKAMAAILGLFVALGLAYALVTPTLEAPDEIYHYDYIRVLIKTGRPPVLEAGGGRGFGHHAPLYYAIGALASFWVGENDLHLWPDRHNPFFGYRFGDVGRDNKNLYIHPDDDRFGTSDTWLGVRVVRVVSVLMGAVTVWVIYRIGREVFPDRPEMGVGAAGLAAFIPEFLFISGAVNDDNGAALFGALSLWAMVRILRQGPTLRRCVALGGALGLGWLSKLTTMALVPTAGLVVAWIAYRRRSWRELLRWGAVVFTMAALFIAPWMVRQILLYGDPTGTTREMTEWGLRERPPSLADLGPDLYWLRTSFWGRMGHNQIPLANWIYDLLDILTLLAILGLARLFLFRRFSSSLRPAALLPASRLLSLAFLALAFLLSLAPMIVRRFLRPMPNFGRYLFPVLPSVALLFLVGLSAWLPQRRWAHLALGLTVGMLALGIAGLVCFLIPAYARPPIYEAATAPGPAHRLDWVYLEDGRPLARLRGYDLDRWEVEPGERARVILHWEVLGTTSENYVLFAQLFGRRGVKVGQRDTYPGLGHYPTSFWKPGQVILDEVPIPVDADAVAPSRLRLDVGLYNRETGERLAVVDSRGNPVGTATAGWLKLSGGTSLSEAGTAPLCRCASSRYRLGDAIVLVGYDLQQDPNRLRLTLCWECLASMERDYTVFVHLIGPDGSLVTQADGPPVDGDYPTSFWAPGEIIIDERVIPAEGLSSGTYHLRVGMYLLQTGERLPAVDKEGVRLPADAIPLVEVNWP